MKPWGGAVETFNSESLREPASNVQRKKKKNSSSVASSDLLEIGGGVDVDGAFLEFHLGDIGGTGFDERFCAGVVWEREKRFETGAMEESGNAESVGVAAGDDWFVGSFPLRDERRDDACIDERLIAGQQNDGVEFRPRAEQMA